MAPPPQDVISKHITRDVPQSWGQDALSKYLETAERNVIATFANCSDVCARLSEIDACFRTLNEGLTNTPNWFESFFLLRAHSAFLTSIRLVTAGAVTESYATCRQAIEFALYGYCLFKQPELREIWLNRRESDESRKLVTNTFRVSEILKRAATDIPQHGAVAKELYERTIEYGAHPNELSVTTTIQSLKNGDDRVLRTIYLHDHDLPKQLALQTVTGTGLCVLGIFQQVHSELFVRLGLNDKLGQLIQGTQSR